VRLWEPHAGWARANVQEGDFVLLRNVHAKLSLANKLEGALYCDRQHPERISISKLAINADKHIGEIKNRKKEYERRRQAKSAPNEPRKASALKSEKRRQKKQGKKAAKDQGMKELEKQEEELNTSSVNSNGELSPLLLKLWTNWAKSGALIPM
jgi:type IV secretory pathway VirB10-like protein